MNTQSKSFSLLDKVKYLCENHGFSENDLAEKYNIRLSDIEAVENSNLNDKEEIIKKLAAIFDLPINYFKLNENSSHDSIDYLTRAMKDLSENDHDELLKFSEFLESMPREN